MSSRGCACVKHKMGRRRNAVVEKCAMFVGLRVDLVLVFGMPRRTLRRSIVVLQVLKELICLIQLVTKL